MDALGGPLAEPSLAPLLEGVNRTRCGALMLPDRSRFGPLYWAVIQRVSSASGDGSGGVDATHGGEASSSEEGEASESDSESGAGSESSGSGDDDGAVQLS